jgi:hypothetical protein
VKDADEEEQSVDFLGRSELQEVENKQRKSVEQWLGCWAALQSDVGGADLVGWLRGSLRTDRRQNENFQDKSYCVTSEAVVSRALHRAMPPTPCGK